MPLPVVFLSVVQAASLQIKDVLQCSTTSEITPSNPTGASAIYELINQLINWLIARTKPREHRAMELSDHPVLKQRRSKEDQLNKQLFGNMWDSKSAINIWVGVDQVDQIEAISSARHWRSLQGTFQGLSSCCTAKSACSNSRITSAISPW